MTTSTAIGPTEVAASAATMRTAGGPMSITHRLDILQTVLTNDAYRREVITGTYEQVVVMTIPPGGEIGDEVHPTTDQLLICVDGRGRAVLEGQAMEIGPNDLVFVRAGTPHNVVNDGDGPLRLITVYAPPEHSPGTVHQTRSDAQAAEPGDRP